MRPRPTTQKKRTPRLGSLAPPCPARSQRWTGRSASPHHHCSPPPAAVAAGGRHAAATPAGTIEWAGGVPTPTSAWQPPSAHGRAGRGGPRPTAPHVRRRAAGRPDGPPTRLAARPLGRGASGVATDGQTLARSAALQSNISFFCFVWSSDRRFLLSLSFLSLLWLLVCVQQPRRGVWSADLPSLPLFSVTASPSVWGRPCKR